MPSPEQRPGGVLDQDPQREEHLAIAARLAQHKAHQELEHATGRMLSAARSLEQAAGTDAAVSAYKAAANARIRYDQALAAWQASTFARAKAEAQAEYSQGAWMILGNTYAMDEMERHVLRWRGARFRSRRDQILKATLALSAEVGELAGDVEKWAYRGNGARLDVKVVVAEMGDVFYNLCDLAIALGVDLGAVVTANRNKWAGRYPEGPIGPVREFVSGESSPLKALWARITGA